MAMKEIFAQINKVEEQPDGTCIVRGVACAEELDKSNEILDWATARPEIEKWRDQALERSNGKSHGNIRSMHGKIAAGIATNLHFDDVKKNLMIESHIIDLNEAAKARQGVYTGYSIGGDYLNRWPDPAQKGAMRYTPKLNEISLVDNPCGPSAVFTYVKVADGDKREPIVTEERHFIEPQRVSLTEDSMAKIAATVAETLRKDLPVTADAMAILSGANGSMDVDGGPSELPGVVTTVATSEEVAGNIDRDEAGRFKNTGEPKDKESRAQILHNRIALALAELQNMQVRPVKAAAGDLEKATETAQGLDEKRGEAKRRLLSAARKKRINPDKQNPIEHMPDEHHHTHMKEVDRTDAEVNHMKRQKRARGPAQAPGMINQSAHTGNLGKLLDPKSDLRQIVTEARAEKIDTAPLVAAAIQAEYPHALSKRTELNKGLFDVATLAGHLAGLAQLEDSLEYEADQEGDGSKIPDRLNAAIKTLQQIFVDLAEEESLELVAEEDEFTAKSVDSRMKHRQLKKGVAAMAIKLTELKKRLETTPGENKTLLAAVTCIDSALAVQKSLEATHDTLGKQLAGLTKSAEKDEVQKAYDKLDDELGNLDEALIKFSETEEWDAPVTKADTSTKCPHCGKSMMAAGADMPSKCPHCGKSVTAAADKAAGSEITDSTRTARRLEKRLERDLEAIKAENDETKKTLNTLLEGIAKMTATPAGPQPVRTAIAVEKTADTGNGVGGVVVTGQESNAAVVTLAKGAIEPTDMYGMPNPDFVNSREATSGDSFIKAAIKSPRKSGNPFPQDFGKGA